MQGRPLFAGFSELKIPASGQPDKRHAALIVSNCSLLAFLYHFIKLFLELPVQVHSSSRTKSKLCKSLYAPGLIEREHPLHAGRETVLAPIWGGFLLGFTKGCLSLPLGTLGKWFNLWDLCNENWIFSGSMSPACF